MSHRPSPPLWAFVTLLLAGTGIVPAVYPLLRPSSPPPQTLAELVELLRRSDPQLRAVAMADYNPEAGVYFCERPRPREQLRGLLRAPECAGRWRGVVFCERNAGLSRVPDYQLHSWGEHGLRVGTLVFFGDPAVLRRIEAAIRR